MDDDYERTLLQLPQVMVFKIPTLKTAGGHRAADWPTIPVWSGKLRIVEKKEIAVIILLDDKNQTFAVCPVTDDAAIDRTTDSGRYFILRIENALGKRAFIGIAFNERNDAFDFNVALSEHKAQREREKQASDFFDASSTSHHALKDLSLKDGEKVKISLSTSTGRKRDKGASGGGLLPPPGSKGLLAPPSSSPASLNYHSSSSSSSADPFAASDSFTDPFAAAPASSASYDPFGFGDFTASTSSSTASKPSSSSAASSGTANLLDF